jgi:hypothetical protein
MSTDTQELRGVLQRAKVAMMKYYTLLCRMPHVKPECLRVPPTGGWSGAHAEDLRMQGWSNEAAEFSRHLPFVAPGLYDAEYAWIVSPPFHYCNLARSRRLYYNAAALHLMRMAFLSNWPIDTIASDLELDGRGF